MSTAKLTCSGKIRVQFPLQEVFIDLSEKDIHNWLVQCKDPEALRRLARAARSYANALEHPDDDDFRSRA